MNRSRRRWILGLLSALLPSLLMNAADPTNTPPASLQRATLGGGCFWCLEAVYQLVPGVRSVTSGYAGGQTANPSYEAVCSGTTGHAEVVQIEFDPAVVSFEKLLETFWRVHDPTSLNRQGADEGTQYRSIVLCHDEAQKKAVEKSMAEAQARLLRRIVTEVAPLKTFYPAEAYHQDYFRKHPDQAYCRMVIQPKVDKFKKAR